MAWEVAFLHFGGCWGCWREKVVSVFRFGHSKSHFKTLLAKVLTFKCLKEMYCVNFKQGAGSTCDSVRVLSKPGNWSPLQKTRNSTLSRAHVASRINIPPIPPIQQRQNKDVTGREGSSYQNLAKDTLLPSSSPLSDVSTSISNTKIQKLQQMLFFSMWLEICRQSKAKTNMPQDCGQFSLSWF